MPDADGDGDVDLDDCRELLRGPEGPAGPPGGEGEGEGEGEGGGQDAGPDGDLDRDGVDNAHDNCPWVANDAQGDMDLDGFGDTCDPDRDGDGWANVEDCWPDDPDRVPGDMPDTSCDGLDDDCDGEVDEEWAPAACQTDEPGECAAGETVCLNGVEVCERVAEPGEEVCNGLDDDCDDAVDEDLQCRPECSNGARLYAWSDDNDIAICKDDSNATCEQDFERLCPAGWHLCTPLEHHARNDGWDPPAHPTPALGVIRCRGGSGAGHYTVNNVRDDPAPNCHWGSSRAGCVAGYGCNEQRASALCCAPLPSCGNGVQDHPEEGCDDGNDDDGDACLSACYGRQC